MKNSIKIILSVSFLIFTMGSCKKYLDINNDASSPQTPSVASLFPPVTAVMSRSIVVGALQAGTYIQNWGSTASGEVYDLHGGNPGGAGANGIWRDFYVVQGTSINLIVKQATIDEQWDYVGAALAVRAWGLQTTTDYFGEMPYYNAWEANRVIFKYDDQDVVYKVIDSICRVSLNYLDRTDGKVSQAIMARGDQVYAGDRAKWKKFVYGILARNWHHQSNKATYNADSVIFYANKSMASNSDNFLIKHSATRNDDTSPSGNARDNFSSRRQSKFAVQLLDGTNFYSNTLPASRDPRLSRMLCMSPDTTTINGTMLLSQNGGYRYVSPSLGIGLGINMPISISSSNYRITPSTPWGDSLILNNEVNNFAVRRGKYLFQGNADFPIMTFFEMQFIKAEAAFRKGDLTTAQISYKNAIGAHFDFVNTLNSTATGVTQITPAEKSNYLGSLAVKQSSLALTLSDIMLQKYIADFGWNLVESWCDLRRYHYFDLDPITGVQVYKNFTIPLYSSNNVGPKPANRFRPTNFSEFDWNFDELNRIGAFNQDYHTYEMWFSQP